MEYDARLWRASGSPSRIEHFSQRHLRVEHGQPFFASMLMIVPDEIDVAEQIP